MEVRGMNRFRLLVIALGIAAIAGGGVWYLSARDRPASGSTTRDVKPVADGDGVWEALAQRPLDLPKLAPGQTCPVTPTAEVLPGQKLPGGGPIYPHATTDGGPLSYGGDAENGWYYMKVLWRSSGDYKGPALIRGRQLGGDQELRFGDGPSPSAALRFPVETGVRSEFTVNGWRDNPSFTRIKSPGCYAWQVDGLDFQSVIVFEARP
jgi:hypothetical protein